MYAKYILVIGALLLGGLLAVQGSINTQLGSFLKHPLQAALTNFLVGTVTLIVVNIILKTGMPEALTIKKIPIYLFAGGIMGAIFVSSIVMLVPKIGVTTTLGATIVGQLIIASVVDHYGFFGIPQHSISLGRIGGMVLLLIGVFLIERY